MVSWFFAVGVIPWFSSLKTFSFAWS